MNFDQILRNFISSRRRGTGTARRQARPRSIISYESDLRYFFDFMKAKPRRYTEWMDITKTDVSEFIDWSQNVGWAPSSQYKLWRALRALFFWIEDDEDCKGLKSFRKLLPKIPQNPTKLYVPPVEDIQKIASSFNKNTRSGLRDYTILMLMIDTGMRSGEIRHMKSEHLNLDQKLVLVPEEGKTGARPIWLTQEAVSDLRRWLDVRAQFAKCDYIFVTDTGEFMSQFCMAAIFSNARKRSGVKKLSAHTIRHYFCTNWVRKGGDIAKLQIMTGHKQLQTLNIYLHLAQDTAVAEELERINPRKGTKPDWRVGRERKKIS